MIERGHEVARLIPSRPTADRYRALSQRWGATVPVARLEDVAARLPSPGSPAGTTDARLADGRRERR